MSAEDNACVLETVARVIGAAALTTKTQLRLCASKTPFVETKSLHVETKANGVETKASTVETKAWGVETKASTVETKVSGVETFSFSVETKVSGVETFVHAFVSTSHTETAAKEVLFDVETYFWATKLSPSPNGSIKEIMIEFQTSRHFKPMTPNERLRQFRERNPGYDMLRMRRKRAIENANWMSMTQSRSTKAQLLLPAPAEPLFDLFSQLEAVRQQQADAVPVPAVQTPAPKSPYNP